MACLANILQFVGTTLRGALGRRMRCTTVRAGDHGLPQAERMEGIYSRALALSRSFILHSVRVGFGVPRRVSEHTALSGQMCPSSVDGSPVRRFGHCFW